MRLSSRISVCALLVLFAAAAVRAQVVPNTPTSGAVVTINGTAGANPVNILFYDSQIHSALVGPNSPAVIGCTQFDTEVQTDAYVLQGGSATGCPPVDSYEITDVATGVTTFAPRMDHATHQSSGSRDISGFHIETHFICVGKCASGGVTGTKTFCNSTLTICINVVSGTPADNGFIKVTNNTGSNFTGTIALQGAPVSGCSAASDSTGMINLASGKSVILAMGTPGTPAVPNTFDSSTCAGFNFDQQQAITAGSPTTFLFGKDTFQITPSNSNPGDVVTFRPVPIPANLFNLPGSKLTNSTRGDGTECVSIADFAAPTGANQPNPVCPEFQTHCINGGAACSDAETFYWTGEFKAHLDPNAGYPLVGGLPEIGGVHFLGAPGVNCAQNAFSDDIALWYIGDTPGDLTGHNGGSGLNCFVTTFDPTAAAVAAGVQVFSFNGFFPPVSDNTFNNINSGQNVGLPFDYANGAGGAPVTNLNWCPAGPSSTDSTQPGYRVCATEISGVPVPEPWVAFLRTPTTCPNGDASTSPSGYINYNPTNSFLHNYGDGSYKFNWATLATESTNDNCFYIGVRFDNGITNPFVAPFQFTK